MPYDLGRSIRRDERKLTRCPRCPSQPNFPQRKLPVVWDADGAPRSRRFGDVYFSTADGLAEARAVFLAGCSLPDIWAGRDRFVIGELGFGSGLNILALLDLWRRHRPPGARLHVFSVEAFPLSAGEARPGLGVAAGRRVAEHYAEVLASPAGPVPRRGLPPHRSPSPERQPRSGRDGRGRGAPDLGRGGRRLVPRRFLARLQSGHVDVGGAGPGRVPVGARRAGGDFHRRRRCPPRPRRRRLLRRQGPWLRPQARAAGGPPARRTHAGRPRQPASHRHRGGRNIAGAALARAVRALGATPTVYDAGEPGASGNPAALVMPRLDAGGGPVAQLYAQAIARAADLYGERPAAVIARGALQGETGPKDPSRFNRIAASDLFPPGAVQRLAADALSGRLGEATDSERPPWLAMQAMVVRPRTVIDRWLGGASRVHAEVATLARDGEAWRLLEAAGAEVGRAEIVCLAAGLSCRALAPSAALAPVRGQVGFVTAAEQPTPAIGRGYVIPTGEGLLFGATHDRDDEATDSRPADTTRNLALLAQLRPKLAASLADAPIEARAGVRAVTPDFLPLAGALAEGPGLYILSGLGSRGFCAAPLLAEHVAAQALGAPSPLPQPLREIVEPGRFARRAQRRNV